MISPRLTRGLRWMSSLWFVLACSGALAASPQSPRYDIDGSISREVLENYLARSITMMDLLAGVGDPDDNLRMLESIGAKFAGRALYVWGAETRVVELLPRAQVFATRVHAADPEIILQAGIYEIVTTAVGEVAVPGRVLEEFGLPVDERRFCYEDMVYGDGRFTDHWFPDASVPDVSRLETQLWIYHLATSYIDAGCEAIHFGQVELMGAVDEGQANWFELIRRIRHYAAKNARRHYVVVDAHVPGGGFVRDGRLLFDFHSFPLRIDEEVENPQHGVLRVGCRDSLFGRSRGGISPSGWDCEHLPFLVELDNFGSSGRGGEDIGGHWIWGYDEIGWFAHQPAEYRDSWLRYAWAWVREHDPNGYLEMPGSRILADPVDGRRWYHANRPSTEVPDGFGQEDVIRAIWAADARAGTGR